MSIPHRWAEDRFCHLAPPWHSTYTLKTILCRYLPAVANTDKFFRHKWKCDQDIMEEPAFWRQEQCPVSRAGPVREAMTWGTGIKGWPLPCTLTLIDIRVLAVPLQTSPAKFTFRKRKLKWDSFSKFWEQKLIWNLRISILERIGHSNIVTVVHGKALY